MKRTILLAIVLLGLAPVLSFAATAAGGAIQFVDEADNEVIKVPQIAAFDLLDNEYTIEAWINPANFAVQRRFLYSQDVFFFATTNSGNVRFKSETGTAPDVVGSTTLSAGTWYHVAVVNTSGSVKLYVNGQLDGSASDANFELQNFSNPLFMGRSLVGDNKNYLGFLEEVRIWKGIRSISQIQEYMGKSIPSPASQADLVAYYKFDGSGQTVTDSGSNGANGTLGGDGTVETNDPLRINSTAPIDYTLIAPDGVALNIGDPVNIEWSANGGLDKVNILWSRDGGSKWDYLAYNTDNDGLLQTFVPGYPTTNAVFRVENPQDKTEFDDSDAFVTINDPGGWQHEIVLEAEDADDMKMHTSVQFDGKAYDSRFIYSTRTAGSDEGYAEYEINVPAPGGLYVVWGRIWGPGSTRNSFYFSVDGGDEVIWDIPKHNRWEWDRVSARGTGGVPPYWPDVDVVFLSLSPGTHTVKIRPREHYARLDRMVITNDLTEIYWGRGPTKWIDFTSPVQDDSLQRGKTWEITWDSFNFGSTVTIKLDVDNWPYHFDYTVVEDAPNTGSYLWTVPDLPNDMGNLMISRNGVMDDHFDITWRPFYFVDPQPDITLTQPNGGEEWYAGDTHDITWNVMAYSGDISLSFSADSGDTWNDFATLDAATGTYEWLVPDSATTNALVKAMLVGAPSHSDVSDSVFTILQRIPEETENYALSFDGIDDFVEVADSASLDLDDQFTLEFMVNTDEPSQSWTRIMEKGSWDEWYVGFYGPKHKLYSGIRADLGNNTTLMRVGFGPSVTTMDANTWYQFTLTYDNGVAKMYVNGVQETETTITYKARRTTGDLLLGAVKRFGQYYSFYNGMIDEVRIFNVARTEQEVQDGQFTRLTGTETGLVAYYPFDEGAGQVAGDASGNGNDGKLGLLTEPDDADPTWVEVFWHVDIQAFKTDLKSEDESIGGLPTEFALHANYPNPFNPTTRISFDLPESADTRLTIFNLNGQIIDVLVEGYRDAGTHTVTWEAAGKPSGVYFYRIDAGSFHQTKRMLLLK